MCSLLLSPIVLNDGHSSNLSSFIVVFQLRESQIVSLYRAGHDTIGEEILNSLDEEQRRLAGIKLLRVCLLRLAAL